MIIYILDAEIQKILWKIVSNSVVCFGRETKGTGGPEASQVQLVLSDLRGPRYVPIFDIYQQVNTAA